MSIQLNQDNFSETVLQSNKPVLVDFWAEGCGPCAYMAPLVDQLAVSHADTATVGKVNVINEMDLAVQYGIRQIPVMMVFVNGEPVDKRVGKITGDELTALLEAHIIKE